MLKIKEELAKELKWDRTAVLKLDALGSPLPLRAPRLRLDLIIAQGVGLGPLGDVLSQGSPRRSSLGGKDVESGNFLVLLKPGGAGKRPPRAVYNSAWETHGANRSALGNELVLSDSFVRKLGIEIEGDLLVRVCRAEPSIAGLAAASLSAVKVLLRAQVNTLFAPGDLSESLRLALEGTRSGGAEGEGLGKEARTSYKSAAASLGGVIRLSAAKAEFDGMVLDHPECLPRETTLDLIFSPIDGTGSSAGEGEDGKNDGPRLGNAASTGAHTNGVAATAATATVGNGHPYKLGYLEKEGGSLFSSWKRRFVVLYDGKLSYYNSAEDGLPLATLDCTQYRAQREVSGAHGKATEFVVGAVEEGGRTFRFRSGTPKDCDEWIMKINESHRWIHGEL